jgi:hypothetical protein
MSETDPAVTAAAEAIEEVAIRRIGRDLGTIHRDEIVGAGVAAALRVIADYLDVGGPAPILPRVYSALLRDRADDIAPIRNEGSR